MRARLLARFMGREARGLGRRLLFFVASLAVGVAAVVAVAGLSATMRRSLAAEARNLLAADVVVSSRRPLPAELEGVLGAAGVERWCTVVELASMAATGDGDRSRLVELKAVGTGYPFYGELRLDPHRPLLELVGDDGVVVAEAALAQLGLAVGDELLLGGVPFTIRGVVVAEPDRALGPISFGPRIFLSREGLDRTGLLAYGSRIRYRALLRLGPGVAASAVEARILAEVPDSAYLRIEAAAEAQPALRDGIGRVERYLGLVALLSLLVGGVGVAQAVRSWLATRMDSIATLRCLGLTAAEVSVVYLGQTALLGLASSALGCLLGLSVQWALPLALADVLPPAPFDPWQLAPLARGLGLGLGIALLFSLPPVLRAGRVPPVRVLRRAVEPPPARLRDRVAVTVAAFLGLLMVAVVQAGPGRLAVLFTAGVIATTVILGLASAALTRGVGRLPRAGVGLWVRHGLAAVARPGADTAAAIVALGLGTLVVLVMTLVEGALAGQLDSDLARGTPSTFLVDIQPDQLEPLTGLVDDLGGRDLEAVPVIMARLRSVDGATVSELSGDGEELRRRQRWALTREQRLTSLERLADDNVVVAGQLWSEPERDEVSVEVEYAERIGAGLGSVLLFDVQGVPLELVVTSLREVDWGTFRINFFLVVEPGVLDRAPHTWLAAASVPRELEERLGSEVAAAFPNVNAIHVREVLEKVSAVMSRLGLGVRFLGSFTVLAGIAILGGAASASAARRSREVALLKALGVTRAGVVAAVAVEYGLVGLVAGLVGAAGGTVVAWAVLEHAFELPFAVDLALPPAAVLGTALLTVIAGLVACAPALRRRPVEALREL